MYLALYRKYRPQTFDDVISQEHITVTLKNQIRNGQTAHAYLFTGSRGTGKTTCAKILAKAVNCLRPVDGNPCLECESCRAIDEGATDVTEIDAASNNGVDSVRGLKEEAVYAPISCGKRVYIIDEVHMLSIAAFNALLKLIEEPPAHVVFIFATTEIHKIPATILSRCQRFEFRRIDINDSKRRLLDVAEKENMRLDENAAYLISRVSAGGMRDALSLLDQCFSVSGHVTEETVRECAGISGSEHLFRIADAAAVHDAPAALAVLGELTERSKSPVRLTEELIAHYRTLMLLKAGADVSTLRMTDSEAKGFSAQSEKYTLEMLMRALSILSGALSGMSRTSSEELLCEMCLIKLCTPKLDTDEAALSGRIDALEKLVLDTVKQLSSGQPAAPVREAAFVPKTEPVQEQPLPEAPEQTEAPFETAAKEPAEFTREAPEMPRETLSQAEQAVEMPIDLPFDIDPPPLPPEPFASDPFPSEPMSLNEALGFPPPEMPAPVPEPEPQKPAVRAEPEEPDIPEGFEPLSEWKTILEALPFSVRVLMGETTAMINGSTVLICGSELQKQMAVGELSDVMTETVSKALGRKVSIIAQRGAKPKANGSQKLNDFLDRARSQGVAIKEE